MRQKVHLRLWKESPEPDEVSVDIIRSAGPVGMQWLKCVKICLGIMQMPKDWGLGEIVALLKKGNKGFC